MRFMRGRKRIFKYFYIKSRLVGFIILQSSLGFVSSGKHFKGTDLDEDSKVAIE
jgi:hypothetical protein